MDSLQSGAPAAEKLSAPFNDSDPDALVSQDDAPECPAGEKSKKPIFNSTEEIVHALLQATDDTSLNPWTFRVWFIGEHCSAGATRLIAQLIPG